MDFGDKTLISGCVWLILLFCMYSLRIHLELSIKGSTNFTLDCIRKVLAMMGLGC